MAKETVVGKTIMQNCGMKATVIAYRSYYDIDIQFEDGTICNHIRFDNFKNGKVLANKNRKISCMGETRMMNCGMNATCIAYRNKNDIDIQFEDGIVVEHKNKRNFYKGEVGHPSLTRKSLINQEKIMRNGEKAKCIRYSNQYDLDVQFEDGTVVEHITKKVWNSGNVKKNPVVFNKLKMMNCGKKCYCIASTSASNCTFKFEDGTIVEGRRWREFLKGNIAYPNYIKNKMEAHVGQTRTMLNNMKATCIAYRWFTDCDFKFEDGTVVKHKKWEHFMNGEIKHPNPEKSQFSCIGEIRMMNCGMKATCIAYRRAVDIDIQFEDGTVVKRTTKTNFYNGKVKNPNIKNR